MEEKDLIAPDFPDARYPRDNPDAPITSELSAEEAPPAAEAEDLAQSDTAETSTTASNPTRAVITDDPDAPVISELSAQETAAVPEVIPAEQASIHDVLPEQLLMRGPQSTEETEEARWLAVLEAIVYITDEPLSAEQIARALNQPLPQVLDLLDKLVAEYNKAEHGLTLREVAGGYKMATKPEHHEAVREFVKNLNPPLKLSLAALETLAVIAYKQPMTAPEVMEIRGVQGAGVLKTLIDRKLITTAGRKNVVGKPILYKTTKEFLVQFGLKDLSELPTLKEFEDLRRMAFADADDSLGSQPLLSDVTPPNATADAEESERQPAGEEPHE